MTDGCTGRGSALERALVVIAALIVLGIAGCTVWAFVTGRARPGSRAAAPSRSGATIPGAAKGTPAEKGRAMFADIGVLRARTSDEKPASVVVYPVLPYRSDDIAFREELVQKTRMARTVVLDWFASRSAGDLRKLGETTVKAELLQALNSCFVLGRVESLYFEEYLILD